MISSQCLNGLWCSKTVNTTSLIFCDVAPIILRFQHFFVKVIVTKSCFVNLRIFLLLGSSQRIVRFQNSSKTSGLACLFSNLGCKPPECRIWICFKYGNRTMNTNEIPMVSVSLQLMMNHRPQQQHFPPPHPEVEHDSSPLELMGNFSGLGPCGNPAKFARATLNLQGCTIHPWRLTACSHTSRGFSYDGIFLSKIMGDGNCRCFPPFLIIQGVSTSGWWFQLKNMKSKLDQIGSLPQLSGWTFQKPLSCHPNINTSHPLPIPKLPYTFHPFTLHLLCLSGLDTAAAPNLQIEVAPVWYPMTDPWEW